MKDENYYTIFGWMLNRLKLKGVSLQVYAIIYGFTQDGMSEFSGSLKYLEDCTGTSKPTIMKALEELVDKKYIFKSQEVVNNVKYNKYRVNLKVISVGGKETLPVVKKLDWGGKETLPGGGKETLPNNNNIDNTNYNKERKKEDKVTSSKNSYNGIIEKYTENVELKDTILEFIKMRKLLKKPLTDRALNILLKKLSSLAKEETTKIAILEESIANSWQTVYPLKNEKSDSYSAKKNTTANNSTVGKDREARLAKLREVWDNEDIY